MKSLGEGGDSGEVAVYYIFKLSPAFAKSMVGDSVLGEIVGSYFFCSHASADHGAVPCNSSRLFFFLFFPKTGS